MYIKKIKKIISVLIAILLFAVSIPVENVYAKDQTENTENQMSKNSSFVVIEKPYLEIQDTQTIVIGLEDNVQVTEALLYYKNITTNEMYSLEQDNTVEGAVSFQITFDSEDLKGTYQIVSMDYSTGGETYQIDFVAEEVEAQFGVGQEVETSPNAIVEETAEEDIVYDIVKLDENGNTISTQSIEEVLDSAQKEISTEQRIDDTEIPAKKSNGNVIVMLDPGHDNTHVGARANGLKEEDLTLKIAQYCREELQQYSGVTVYMTRGDDGSCPYPGTDSGDCNERRVTYAKSVGANVYVSIHLNSVSSTSATSANGAEVYYPNNNYNASVGSQGQALASVIQNKLVALGLYNRGIKIKESENGTTYPDGSLADYYGVIRNSKKQGIPAVIVEHAFLTNSGDVNNYLNSDEKLRNLGIADATAIAEYFGLNKNIRINGIGTITEDNGIKVGCSYSSDTAVSFRWLVYNLGKQQWELLSDWTSSNWVYWQPELGNYWIRVEAQNSRGETTNYTQEYSNGKNYSPAYLNLQYITSIDQGDRIDVGVGYESLSQTQFRWLVYDLNKQQWELLSDWTSGNWVSWKPEPGNYWVRAEAKNSNGTVTDKTIDYYVQRDYTGSTLTLQGMMYSQKNDRIEVGTAYSNTADSVEFRWLLYDVDKGQWNLLGNWTSSNWISWKPIPGNYWLQVEARNSDGFYKKDLMTFSNTRDYVNGYIEISGIYVVQNQFGYSMGAVNESSDANTQYQWLIYNIDKGNWETLSDWNTSNWAEWYPQNGNYLLYVTGKTSKGITANCSIGYTVNNRTAIMGMSTTNLQQMVNYYNANAFYPSYYAQNNSGAPNIETFCRIYLEECQAEGVKAEVAFCQAMKETGFLRFGGRVDISQYNFAGIGAVDSGTGAASFPDVRTGIRAQIQHLKAYASKDALVNPCVDPRFSLVTRNTAPYIEWLGIQENPYGKGWATAQGYGYSIINDYMRNLNTH